MTIFEFFSLFCHSVYKKNINRITKIDIVAGPCFKLMGLGGGGRGLMWEGITI